MSEKQNRLHGVIDMHIHSKPDIKERRSSDVELAEEARHLGLRAIVIKSHVVPTVARAWVAEQIVPGVRVFGGIALNREVGGLNPHAVFTAVKMGGKIVWLPTIWAANERKRGHGTDDGIQLLSRGKVVPEVDEVLKIIADADVVLGMGHQSFEEAFAVSERARELGVEKIVINHPEWPTVAITIEEQQKLLPLGVYFERTFARRPLGQTAYVSNFPINLEAIRALGPESTIISTDGGQTDAPFWGDAIARYVDFLFESGFSDESIDIMTRRNPAKMLGLKNEQKKE